MTPKANLPVVAATSLTHWYPGTGRLFQDLSLRLQGGEITGIVGPSGCGKSTLLSILSGLERPRSGSVTRNHVDHAGWVFQHPYGIAGRSAVDHVALPLMSQGLPWRQASSRAAAILRLFGLEERIDYPFAALSGGEAQRVMLARIYASAPELILVDEPTAQLDSTLARSVNGALRSLSEGGSIVVIATHDPATIHICDAVIDLSGHRDGEPDEAT